MKAKKIIINNIELLYIKNSNPDTFHLELNFNAGYNHSQKSQVPHILEHLFATFPKETSENLAPTQTPTLSTNEQGFLSHRQKNFQKNVLTF